NPIHGASYFFAFNVPALRQCSVSNRSISPDSVRLSSSAALRAASFSFGLIRRFTTPVFTRGLLGCCIFLPLMYIQGVDLSSKRASRMLEHPAHEKNRPGSACRSVCRIAALGGGGRRRRAP